MYVHATRKNIKIYQNYHMLRALSLYLPIFHRLFLYVIVCLYWLSSNSRQEKPLWSDCSHQPPPSRRIPEPWNCLEQQTEGTASEQDVGEPVRRKSIPFHIRPYSAEQAGHSGDLLFRIAWRWRWWVCCELFRRRFKHRVVLVMAVMDVFKMIH